MTQVDFNDFGVVLELLHRPFGQNLSLMQHRDLVGDVLDEFHVMLDDQHGAVLDDAVQQLGSPWPAR